MTELGQGQRGTCAGLGIQLNWPGRVLARHTVRDPLPRPPRLRPDTPAPWPATRHALGHPPADCGRPCPSPAPGQNAPCQDAPSRQPDTALAPSIFPRRLRLNVPVRLSLTGLPQEEPLPASDRHTRATHSSERVPLGTVRLHTRPSACRPYPCAILGQRPGCFGQALPHPRRVRMQTLLMPSSERCHAYATHFHPVAFSNNSIMHSGQ